MAGTVPYQTRRELIRWILEEEFGSADAASVVADRLDCALFATRDAAPPLGEVKS